MGMNGYKYFFGVLFLSLLTACNPEKDAFIATNPELYERGREVYNAQCAVCHGINGEGQFPNAPMIPDATGRYGAPPHNDDGHTWHHADDLLFRIVRDGGMGDPQNFYPMPAFGQVLNEQDIQAVLFYIKGFWTQEHRDWQAEVTAQNNN